jgi:hypothetical protein
VLSLVPHFLICIEFYIFVLDLQLEDAELNVFERFCCISLDTEPMSAPFEAKSLRPDIFERIKHKVADHVLVSLVSRSWHARDTKLSFYLSEHPPIVVKEIIVRATDVYHAIDNEEDATLSANHWVISHTHHEDPNISSVVAWEKSPLQDSQYVRVSSSSNHT